MRQKEHDAATSLMCGELQGGKTEHRRTEVYRQEHSTVIEPSSSFRTLLDSIVKVGSHQTSIKRHSEDEVGE